MCCKIQMSVIRIIWAMAEMMGQQEVVAYQPLAIDHMVS